MSGRRALLLTLLIYVALDFSLPEMPGAFVFDPAGSVDSIEVARTRLTSKADIVSAPSREPLLVSQERRSDLKHRLRSGIEAAFHWRPAMNCLPRATPASVPPSEDPH